MCRNPDHHHPASALNATGHDVPVIRDAKRPDLLWRRNLFEPRLVAASLISVPDMAQRARRAVPRAAECSRGAPSRLDPSQRPPRSAKSRAPRHPPLPTWPRSSGRLLRRRARPVQDPG
eukprot:2554320-Rhodomonas_salina.1